SRTFSASASEKPVYKDSTGDKYEYEGQSKDNLPHGHGVANYFSGDRYVGEYVDGERHGQGTYTVTKGGKYVGEWENDKRHGQGTHLYANGTNYVGGWKDGKHSGQGTQTFADGSTYIGGWKDGKWHGQGTATYVGGGEYIGEWEDGKIHGQGTFTWANGDKYTGAWKNYKHNGQGTKTWANGDKYVGEWKDDKKNGLGTQIWADGSKYAGEWREGKPYKQEAYTSANSDKHVRGLENGNKREQETYTAVDSRKGKGKTNAKSFASFASLAKWLLPLILVLTMLIMLIYNILSKRRKRTKKETAFRDYYRPVFALAAKVAKSDGAVTPNEIKEVESFIKVTFKFNSEERRFAISVFTEAKDNDVTVEEYLSQFTKIADPVHYRGLVCFLVALAMADGELKAKELEILFIVEKTLKLPKNFVKDTLEKYGWHEDEDNGVHTDNSGLLKHHYDVLNLTESATNDEITRAYRQKAKEFHPDKISSKGLQDEFIKFASKKFIEVQAAYEAIKNNRSL
ncbi:MAG: TerB family tellurite resistance protein, partial [Candidatus Anammoxibacter sp.]